MTHGYTDMYGRDDLLRAALAGDLVYFEKHFKRDPEALTRVDNNKDAALHLAAMRGNCAVIKFLLKHGANRKATDKFGATALHLAAITGHAEAVKCLLLYDDMDDINAQDINGNTPAHVAATRDKTSALRALIEHGADLDIVNKYDQTVSDVAKPECLALIVVESLPANARVDVEGIRSSIAAEKATLTKGAVAPRTKQEPKRNLAVSR